MSSIKALIVFPVLLITALTATAFASEPEQCASAQETMPAWLMEAELPGSDQMPHEKFNYDYQTGTWREVSYGVGHLTMKITSDNSSMLWDWERRIEMPLYDSPGGEAWGWFVKGSVADLKSNEIEPVGTAGMLEVGYEQLSFIVLEKTTHGWMKVRFGAFNTMRGGTAWIPLCVIDDLSPQLEFESWEELFLSDRISPMFFRSKVPHALREAPSTESARVAMISGSHHLEPLEIKDDWMRVKAVTPSNYCAGDDMKVTVREGWIKWRSPEKGPWVWFYTRGC